MIQAILLSTVARHYALLQKNFVERYPNAWLVWEPGKWNAPELRIELPETRWPPSESTLRVSSSDDPLCFPFPKTVPNEVVSVGRASTNAVVLNDATVSRQHLLMSRDDGGAWQVEVVAESKFAMVQEVKVTPPAKVAVPSGGKIQLGDVVLSFYGSADFIERVRQIVA
jgi:FHA domain